MSDQERLAIEEKVRNPGLSSGTVEEVRANYELMGEITPVADGVTVEPTITRGCRPNICGPTTIRAG